MGKCSAANRFEWPLVHLLKKKEFTRIGKSDEVSSRVEKYQSAFKRFSIQPQKEPQLFVLPEGEDASFDLQTASAWDVATRYHEFKSKRSSRDLAKQLRKLSVSAILERAQAVMGSVVRPLFQRVCPLPDLPMDAQQVDVDLDETLENAPWMSVMEDAITPNDIWMSYNVHRPQSIVLCIDTSLSMTGEKLALTAVALAVVLLEFPEDPVSIVAFENEAIILKKLNESLSIEALVERFLDVPAQGYTHLEDGMKAALRMVQQAESFHTGRRPSVVLLTDGKYTAGRDPAYLANHFPHLVLLKMGNEKASQNLCRELATQGHGSLHEVGELEALPTIMYNVVKDLLRGHAIRA